MNQLYTPAKRNQLANTMNPFQGFSRKALCVCSAGLLRSPSMALALSKKGFNTRACGTSQEYALIPLSEALLYWADEIHVVKEQQFTLEQALIQANLEKTPVYVYDIPDNYQTFSTELMEIIESEYQRLKQ